MVIAAFATHFEFLCLKHFWNVSVHCFFFHEWLNNKQSLDEFWAATFVFVVFIRIPLALGTLPDGDGSLPS